MDQDRSKVVDLLNTILRLEYSIIVHMPQIAGRIEDKKTRELALSLGTDYQSEQERSIKAESATRIGIGGGKRPNFGSGFSRPTFFGPRTDKQYVLS